MQEQHERPVTTEQEEQNQSEPRRTWERPILQRLYVSLDTAFGETSGVGLSFVLCS
jgi:hypothetical protein